MTEMEDKRLKRLREEMNESSLKECLQIAIDNRKLEIELLWKRSLAFAGFVAALFVAITQSGVEQQQLKIVLGAAGAVLSFVWSLANRASKSWQESWELKAKAYSQLLYGSRLVFAREEQDQSDVLFLLRPRKLSVSRLLMVVSDFTFLFWIGLLSYWLLASKYINPMAASTIWAAASGGYILYIALFCQSRTETGGGMSESTNTETNDSAQNRLEHLKHLYGLEYEMIRATAAFEHAAIRPLFILNGGALVVYLGLFGALNRNDGAAAAIDWSVGRFAAWLWITGLVFAALAVFSGALSQFSFRKLRSQEIVQAEIELGLHSGATVDAAQASGKYGCQGSSYRKASIAMGIVSIIFFIFGFWPAFQSIVK